jgi:hypothetical protein
MLTQLWNRPISPQNTLSLIERATIPFGCNGFCQGLFHNVTNFFAYNYLCQYNSYLGTYISVVYGLKLTLAANLANFFAHIYL